MEKIKINLVRMGSTVVTKLVSVQEDVSTLEVKDYPFDLQELKSKKVLVHEFEHPRESMTFCTNLMKSVNMVNLPEDEVVGGDRLRVWLRKDRSRLFGKIIYQDSKIERGHYSSGHIVSEGRPEFAEDKLYICGRGIEKDGVIFGRGFENEEECLRYTNEVKKWVLRFNLETRGKNVAYFKRYA